MHFSHSAAWKILEKDSAVSILHAYLYRVGNCNCLLSNTARWLSTANNLQEFFVHLLYPLILDHSACFKSSVHGLKIPHSQILLDTSFHHSFQSVIMRIGFLLMNLHFVQFQHGLEFLRLFILNLSKFPRCHQLGFVYRQ